MNWIRIGCLTVIAIPLVLAALVGGLALSGGGKSEPGKRELVQEIPSAGGAVSEPGATTAATEAAISEITAGPGTVALDLSGVELYVRSSPKGTPIHVRAVYDETAGELQESFEADSGEGWAYTLRFRPANQTFFGVLSNAFDDTTPQIAVFLPLGTPMALDLKLAQSGGLADLGGLWLTTIDLGLQQGGLEMVISEPLAQPLERFTSTGNMSGVEIGKLGNASPQIIDLKQRMGGFELDLSGEWLQDSLIAASVLMGGGAIRVPENVMIKGISAGNSDSSDDNAKDLPTLTISIEATMGEVEILR